MDDIDDFVSRIFKNFNVNFYDTHGYEATWQAILNRLCCGSSNWEIVRRKDTLEFTAMFPFIASVDDIDVMAYDDCITISLPTIDSSVTIPVRDEYECTIDVDDVSSTFRNGVLDIVMKVVK